MKRVHLRTLDDVRTAAVAIATWAVNDVRGRDVGDSVHEWVTEGRRAQYERAYRAGAPWALKMAAGYSSCGDLAHFVLMLLGARDESIVNRGDDGGLRGWAVGANISRLVRCPWYVRFGVDASLALPLPGDIVHIAPPDHVAVLLADGAEQWLTADYGQPYGARRVAQLRDVATGLQVRGRMLRGFVSLERAWRAGAFVESAIVPDACDVGELDDNPYDEALAIPEGVG